MKRKGGREIQIFSLSFLDVVSCGFGAMILILVITLAFEPTTVREVTSTLKERLADSTVSREQIVAEHMALLGELESRKRQLADMQAQLATMNTEWETVRRQQGAAQASAEASARAEAQLRVTQQSLSEEMKRLLSQTDYRPPSENATIGGIPVDSEYVIFVIDTSGSMKQGAWPLVVRKMQEVLDSYPHVKGLQVLNDVGTYMFPSYASQWIPDTPARRSVVIDRLKSWNSFSASNPAPGIVQAIRTFYRPGQPTSIYVFGDDFNGRSIEEVVQAVRRLNPKTASGQSLVRIHTFGFPVLPILLPNNAQANAHFTRFAHLMRTLAEENSGSFVGMPTLR
jgi:hypothetical protein